MDMIHITVDGVERECEKGTVLEVIAKEVQADYKSDIVLAMVDGKLSELTKVLNNDCTIKFIGTDTVCGIETYRRSVVLLMIKSFYIVCGEENIEKLLVDYSLSKGYYCELYGKVRISEDLLRKVKEHMEKLVEQNVPIVKETLNTREAIERFRRHKMYDKEKLFKFRRGSNVNVYRINRFEDYFYGYMVPSTGYLKYFDLYCYDEGFVLQLPVKENPSVVPEFKPQHKVFNVLKEASAWGRMMDIETVGALNEQISDGKIKDIILVQEALQEMKIARLASDILNRRNTKFVMIAGPSSSGKTTFAKRLSIQLTAHGVKPHTISVDDYFLNRCDTPRDENGDYNYEILEALDVKLFNEDMTNLMEGKEVELPTFNFHTGKREYTGKNLKLGVEDILIIEGIHCLNDKLSYSLPKESKFKIYISALTQLNVDEHNRIATTDGRLIRRMVRDARYRSTTAEETIARWASVRKGEENCIFPYQEEADAMFNSALIYELGVLKQFAEPLLFNVPIDSPQYHEAKRLLKFLDYFLTIDSELIPANSLIREFIGGSVFYH